MSLYEFASSLSLSLCLTVSRPTGGSPPAPSHLLMTHTVKQRKPFQFLCVYGPFSHEACVWQNVCFHHSDCVNVSFSETVVVWKLHVYQIWSICKSLNTTITLFTMDVL